MSHLLKDFDNRRVPLFYLGSKLIFVRIITSQEVAKYSPGVSQILAPIAFETQKRTIEKLKATYPDIKESWFESKKSPIGAEKMQKWQSQFFPQLFSSKNNYTAISLEDEGGNQICATSFTINDESNIETFRLKDRQGPVIFFDLAQTLKDFSGKGLLKAIHSHVIPDLLHKAGFEKCYYANSMKVFTATNERTGEIINSCINFPIHNSIFKFCGDEVFFLPRYKREGEDISLPGDEMMNSSLFFNDKGFDEAKLSDLISACREKAKSDPDISFEGFFMITKIQDLEELKCKSEENLLKKDIAFHSPEKIPLIEEVASRTVKNAISEALKTSLSIKAK